MPGTTSTALPSFSHDQHHETDAAKRKEGEKVRVGLWLWLGEGNAILCIVWRVTRRLFHSNNSATSDMRSTECHSGCQKCSNVNSVDPGPTQTRGGVPGAAFISPGLAAWEHEIGYSDRRSSCASSCSSCWAKHWLGGGEGGGSSDAWWFLSQPVELRDAQRDIHSNAHHRRHGAFEQQRARRPCVVYSESPASG